MTQSALERFGEAKTLEAERQFVAAEALYETLRDVPELKTRVSRRRTECLFRLQRWREAGEEVTAIFEAESPNNSDIKRWLSVRAALGDGARPTDPVSEYARSEREVGRYPEGPYILFTAAAPKTGSTSFSVALAAALGAEKVNYLDLPPHNGAWGLPWFPTLDILRGCALVNHCHLSPDPTTLDTIATMPWVRIAVHLRNPFETIESTIDMVIRQRSPNLLSGATHLAQSSDEDLRAWVMGEYLRRYADWMKNWVAIVDAKHPSVIGLSTMDDMRMRGQDAVARELVANLPGITVQEASTEPQLIGVRIVGSKKIILRDDERARIRAAFPQALLERFGWTQ